MNSTTKPEAYGELPEPMTLKIQRLLPGPIERIWAYLTDSELRRKWLAAGDMDAKAGASFELVWRNDELTDPPGEPPAGFGGEHRMQSRITEFDPPRKLSITWNSTGDVTFELEPKGKGVLLTIIHRRFPDRATLLKHMAGWHMHLDVLVARANGEEPAPFWDGWSGLMKEYDARLPA
ncbi:SRPBCC family protein [Bradyrhizobium australiense]|uniref:SRPBCC family protein n=1 Tax=Bradyrhizobium australiense TaxID=2721161 RepID=A0A7Y4LW55_9BRAD|nr:SRPBCC family protein [Bradyrhizobium australiense]NOJ40784.1 SRPBCC family protein [Bradyrhizobium australiense]